MTRTCALALAATVVLLLRPALGAGVAENPILVLVEQEDFGLYTGEMLRAEGFNEFQVEDLDDAAVTQEYLESFDVVVLTRKSLSSSQADLITSYVNAGGNLIAFRPDKQLAGLFGLTDQGSTLSEKYLKIETSTAIGSGLVSESMRFHDTADVYTLNGATAVAALYSDISTATTNPAVTVNQYGVGTAVAFVYNLPACVVGFRQGNWALTGDQGNGDGVNGRRHQDKFVDGWVDISKNHINQADEQMRLLSAAIVELTSSVKPLPRMWYFPHGRKAVILWDNDGEGNSGTEFEGQFQAFESKGAKMTLYIQYENNVTSAQVADWISRGHEISCHPDNTGNDPNNPTWSGMYNAMSSRKAAVEGLGTGPNLTVRNHWHNWCDKNEDGSDNNAAQLLIQEQLGFKMSCMPTHSDNSPTLGHYLGGTTDPGNYIGSGLTMRNANQDGRIIDVYSCLTNVYDQLFNAYNDKVGYRDAFKAILDRSLDNEVYSVVHGKAHYWLWGFTRDPIMGEGGITPGAFDYANTKGIPVETNLDHLEFMLMKDGATFADVSWAGDILSFTLDAPVSGSGLTFMVPSSFGGGDLTQVTVDGSGATTVSATIKGRAYAFVIVDGGGSYAVEASYTSTASMRGAAIRRACAAPVDAVFALDGSYLGMSVGRVRNSAPRGGVLVLRQGGRTVLHVAGHRTR